jgi:hypothetical protein
MSVAIEYHSSRRRYRQKSNALILCDLGVVLAAHELKVIKPDSQDRQQQDYEESELKAQDLSRVIFVTPDRAVRLFVAMQSFGVDEPVR